MKKQACSKYRYPHLRPWWKEGAGHSVQVLWGHLDADVVEAHLVEVQRVPPRADVALAGVSGEGDGLLQVTLWQVVTDGTVHIVLSGKWKVSRGELRVHSTCPIKDVIICREYEGFLSPVVYVSY